MTKYNKNIDSNECFEIQKKENLMNSKLKVSIPYEIEKPTFFTTEPSDHSSILESI